MLKLNRSTDQLEVLSVLITGKVQGVGYRWWTRQTALELGLVGWVQNQPDGSVAALFAGRPDRIDAMLRACREGPPTAVVSKVEEQPMKAEDKMFDVHGFTVRQ